MAKIYVLNSAGHDFSAAERFGELVIVTEGNVNIFHTDRVVYTIAEALKDIAEGDFLLLSGTPPLTFLATLYILKETTIGHINILIWNARQRDYVPRRFALRN